MKKTIAFILIFSVAILFGCTGDENTDEKTVQTSAYTDTESKTLTTEKVTLDDLFEKTQTEKDTSESNTETQTETETETENETETETQNEKEISFTEELICRQRYIIHGFGRLYDPRGGYDDGSCSLEAFLKYYGEGYRLFEVDLMMSADKCPICLHHWSWQMFNRFTPKEVVTKDMFLSYRIYGKYTPLWIGNIAELMERYDDFFLILDVKDDNIAVLKYISENYPDLLSRFLPQIYSESEYDTVKGLGFENIIFTVYRLEWEHKSNPEYIRAVAERIDIKAIVFDAALISTDGYTEELKKTGLPLMVHTVNDENEQKACFDMGISGVYCDTPGK